jgi:regulator of protease activity HflC (stomatin/prohibitin superfamily)
MLSFLFALALAQAEPPAMAAAAAVTPPAAEDGDIPKGAPSADYDFVAWCHGALTGHMALYEMVKPELKSIERPEEVADDEKADVEQMKAGREYLALYTHALHAASKAHPKEMAARREKAEAQGEAIWDAAKAAEPRTRMWSWLLWDLPGRCEVAAKRLETRSGVLGGAFKTSEDAAPAPAANAPAAEPPPAPAPQPAAPADGPKSIDEALPPSPPSSPPPAAPPLRGPQ